MQLVSGFFVSMAVVCVMATAQAQTWKPRIDPNLSEANWAEQASSSTARATEVSGLTIAHLDTNRGLLAVYKSTTGTRVMFLSRYDGRERMVATVQVQSSANGQVATVLATRKPTRGVEGAVNIQGVDVIVALSAHRAGK